MACSFKFSNVQWSTRQLDILCVFDYVNTIQGSTENITVHLVPQNSTIALCNLANVKPDSSDPRLEPVKQELMRGRFGQQCGFPFFTHQRPQLVTTIIV